MLSGGHSIGFSASTNPQVLKMGHLSLAAHRSGFDIAIGQMLRLCESVCVCVCVCARAFSFTEYI